MNIKGYYLGNWDAWQRHVPHCVEAHFIVLPAPNEKGSPAVEESRTGPTGSSIASPPLILALITADEAAHIALENDAEFEPLPHPLARTPVTDHVVAALRPFGVTESDDTFTIAEKLARVNPLLRYRVF